MRRPLHACTLNRLNTRENASPSSLFPKPKSATINTNPAPLSLLKSTGAPIVRTNSLKTLSNSNLNLVHMASSASSSKIGQGSGRPASGEGSALQVRGSAVISGALPVFGPACPGTGFDQTPPLAIICKPFHFVKSMRMKSVGLGLDCVPFHGGWELVEWKPTLTLSEVIEM